MYTYVSTGWQHDFLGLLAYFLHLPEKNSLGISEESHKIWDNDRVLARVERVWEFKHYRANGSKFWTSKAGIDYVFAVPICRIELAITDKAYTHIPIKIGGRRFTISCGGGTFGGPGWWTDTVHQGCSLCVGHSLKNLRHVASNAVDVDEAKSLGIAKDFCKENERRYDCWRDLWAKEVVKESKDKITKIVLAAGFSYADSRGPFDVVRRPGKRDRRFAAKNGNDIPFRIKQSQIDWLQTAAANELNIHEPAPFNRIGKLYTWEERMARTG